MAPVKVAVAGATGNIGIPIVNELLAAGFSVTALVRHGSTSVSKLPQNANLAVKEVDYTSVPELTSALQGHSAVVSTLATASVGEQNPLIDAAVAAGVTRFFPSEFGSDTTNASAAKLPVFAYKVATEEYLKTKVAQNPTFSYTSIVNNAFFDWGLAVGFIVNPAQHSAVVYDGGDRKFSTTRLSTVAKAVVGVLNHLEETKNRAVFIQDAVVTQNQLIAAAKEKDGKEWDITPLTTQQSVDQSYAELAKGDKADIMKAMYGFIPMAIYGEGYGGNFSDRLDNELLGLKGLDEQGVKELVWSFV